MHILNLWVVWLFFYFLEGGWVYLLVLKLLFFLFCLFFFYGHKYLFLGFNMTNEWSYYERGICPLVWGLFFLLLGMPLWKTNSILSLVNGFLVDLPSTSNISYFWIIYYFEYFTVFSFINYSRVFFIDAFFQMHVLQMVLLFLSLYSYWTRVLLRGLFEIPCLECWGFAFFIDHGDRFYGLCFALGPNVFLGRDCYF